MEDDAVVVGFVDFDYVMDDGVLVHHLNPKMKRRKERIEIVHRLD